MSRAGSVWARPAPSASRVGSPSTSPSQITTRSRRITSPTSGASRGQSASTVSTTRAPESSRRTASSSVVSITFTDTAMAPSFRTAWYATANAGMFGRKRATRSPGPTPQAPRP